MQTIAAEDLTIGICHPAYQIEPVVKERLPEARVFQELNTISLRPHMPEVDLLVISGAWQETLLTSAERLKWIQSIGVGFNQFPLEELKRRGICLTNAAGVNANAVSEHAYALLYLLHNLDTK